MNVSNEYRMMIQEGHLSSTSILVGFDSLCKLDYDRPGSVYLALFQLATGLERMMKIVIILDYKVSINLASPSNELLKKLGHSITDLYAAVRHAASLRAINDGWFERDTIQGEILATLSEFARGSRYYNIDQIVGESRSTDPLIRWFAIHMEIAEHALSSRRRCKIMEAARSHCEMLGQLGWEMGPRGQFDLKIDVTYQLQIANASRAHCVWHVIQILEPIYRLIEQIIGEIHEIEATKEDERENIPYMLEFLPFWLADKKIAITRKAWSSLFYIGGRV